MSSLFYADDLADRDGGALVTVDGREAHHAAVNRLRVGEQILLGDGRGTLADASVEAVSPTSVSFRIGDPRRQERPTPEIWLAQALAKGDRDELAIQAATEVGVSGVIPLQAARSISRWSGPKVEKGVTRWTSIVREASKQAIRAWVPEVTAPLPPADLVADGDAVLVLDPRADVRLADAVRTVPDSTRRIVLAVGPEGGFTPEELTRLEDAGAVLVVLGDTVLRTSTAGPAAIAVTNVALGRW
ncbi:16S rRNA (uracil1498-N3)-methyltransferase [Labedella gwakjiensis]|uniref:Ribosomal RNA small subunit methyltransferase E n=1 Tax=Labedella gwakjiensis TaxID=390269 RepID=A0A2P8H0A2_9MICO|nr:16S rRNA (uracil(1498)-N(3))-methyltransferase [Labedella gwakjiensis]PSL39629.1 16S rRNA (uracil1498-N3)-methyltransferase [Labedella gwakjiensis]RUQ85982.1 16S rRNA (uracil(1498)-N(3))-methyltransferase [Labedella gwakjiensis]